MTSPATTVIIDCPAESAAPSMRIAGMSLLERLIHQHLDAGTERVLVRTRDHALPEGLPDTVQPLAADADAPADARTITADTIQGVQITDEASRTRAEWAVMQTCRRPYDGPGDRYFNRHFSLRISRFLTRFPVRPNHVTCVSILFGLAACWLAADASERLVLTGAGIAILIQVILDCCDGELARIRRMGSRSGMWLDNISDDLIDNLFVACVGIGLGGPWLYIGLGAAAARLFMATVIYISVARAGHPGDVMAFRWWFDDGDSETEELYQGLDALTLLRALGRRDMYVLVFAAACIVGVPEIAIGLGAVNAAIQLVLTVIHLAVVSRR